MAQGEGRTARTGVRAGAYRPVGRRREQSAPQLERVHAGRHGRLLTLPRTEDPVAGIAAHLQPTAAHQTNAGTEGTGLFLAGTVWYVWGEVVMMDRGWRKEKEQHEESREVVRELKSKLDEVERVSREREAKLGHQLAQEQAARKEEAIRNGHENSRLEGRLGESLQRQKWLMGRLKKYEGYLRARREVR